MVDILSHSRLQRPWPSLRKDRKTWIWLGHRLQVRPWTSSNRMVQSESMVSLYSTLLSYIPSSALPWMYTVAFNKRVRQAFSQRLGCACRDKQTQLTETFPSSATCNPSQAVPSWPPLFFSALLFGALSADDTE